MRPELGMRARGLIRTIAQILRFRLTWPMSYLPRPLDAASVVLPSHLVQLTERLAENAHDLWAVQRMKEGWTYGPQRDDRRKLHPCLVPYAELPESEKEYDRQTALGTLKGILRLGCRIVPPET